MTPGDTAGLTIIGLGLFDERDISLKGLEAARTADTVFAEFYTAVLGGSSAEKLSILLDRKITVLNREEVETGDIIMDAARKGNAALLVVGDPLAATTHAELRLRCRREKLHFGVIHGASALIAVPGMLGLQHYKFGRTTTLPFPQKGYFPQSPYDAIADNRSRGLHTLVLLDIQADTNRLMSANDGLKLLAELENRGGRGILGPDSLVCVVARAGSQDSIIRAGPLSEMQNEDFGPPHHSIVVPGKLHFLEAEALVELAGAPQEILKDC